MRAPQHNDVVFNALKNLSNMDERAAQYEELLGYIQRLVDPPEDTLRFDDYFPNLVSEIRRGTQGTAADRLCSHSTVRSQDASVLRAAWMGLVVTRRWQQHNRSATTPSTWARL